MALNIWLTRRGRYIATSASTGRWADILFGSTLATYVPWFMAYMGVFARADGEALFICLGIVIVVALVASIVLFRRNSHAFAAIAASCAISLAALAFYALITGAKVQAAAETLAQSRAYCILSGNAAVAKIWDLTILNLRAIRNLNYHALLIIRNDDADQPYNWSYRRRQFEPARMVYEPDRICSPKVTP